MAIVSQIVVIRNFLSFVLSCSLSRFLSLSLPMFISFLLIRADRAAQHYDRHCLTALGWQPWRRLMAARRDKEAMAAELARITQLRLAFQAWHQQAGGRLSVAVYCPSGRDVWMGLWLLLP